jgi:hypothetical protein
LFHSLVEDHFAARLSHEASGGGVMKNTSPKPHLLTPSPLWGGLGRGFRGGLGEEVLIPLMKGANSDMYRDKEQRDFARHLNTNSTTAEKALCFFLLRAAK